MIRFKLINLFWIPNEKSSYASCVKVGFFSKCCNVLADNALSLFLDLLCNTMSTVPLPHMFTHLFI